MPSFFTHPNVSLGQDAQIGQFVILGEPPRGKVSGELNTIVGTRAIIRSHTVIYAGNIIGDDFQTGHGVVIRESNRIGDRVSVGSNSIIEHSVIIGNGVRFHGNVFIPEFSILENNTWIGPNVVFTNARYPLSRGVKLHLKGPRIRQGAKIGANATLLPGIEIGANALVGAGAVVVQNVPEGMVVAGNPAKVIGRLDEIEEYKLLAHQVDTSQEQNRIKNV